MTDYADKFLNYKKLARERGIKGDTLFNDNIGFDDPLDAFRHAYTSGFVTRFIGSVPTAFLGFLVELKGVVVDDEHEAVRKMDFHNNRIGRRLGKIAKSPEHLADLVAEAIKTGETINYPRFKFKGDTYPIPIPKPTEEMLIQFMMRPESKAKLEARLSKVAKKKIDQFNFSKATSDIVEVKR